MPGDEYVLVLTEGPAVDTFVAELADDPEFDLATGNEVHDLLRMPGPHAQASVLRSRSFRRAVIRPEVVATRIVEAVESGKRELFVPRWYRVFAVVQALFPGLSALLVARSGYRRPA